MTNNSLLICIFIFSIIISSVVGYILGRINSISGNYVSQSKKSEKKHVITNSISDISIDDKKFVTDIKTDSFEKKYDSLGDTKKSKDNIKNSVNKLKNMKG
jgi:hypothetical protein